MAKGLAIYHPAGRVGLGTNPFGKDVANRDLFRALARHGGFDQLDVMTHEAVSPADLAQGLLDGAPSATRLTPAGVLDQPVAAAAGALLRGTPALEDLAWLRRSTVGDRAYSLLGLVHTLAPQVIRHQIGMASLAPIQRWDALICTSPSVRQALGQMFDEWEDHLAERFKGQAPPRPHLPLIPLGVDQAALQARADRPQVRADLRAELGLAQDDVLILWVGRLSFFEKAFPQPMFRAVEEAMQANGVKVHFAMAGWFPGGEADRSRYQEAARAYAPSIPIHFIDGNDQDQLGRLWAGADVFLSLVDNIQETFGITPVEAMACGLPVVVSDWDGYRYTVRDGCEGFLIPTLGGPPGGLGRAIGARHAMFLTTYQAYVGVVAQHTAVHVGRAAQALGQLIASPELRRKMGAAGRARVRDAFDWPVVVGQYQSLLDELADIRGQGDQTPPRHATNPLKGDPFRDFAGFASHVLNLETPLRVRPGVGGADLDRAGGLALDAFGGAWRGSLDECRQVLDLLGQGGARSVREILLAFPMPRRRHLELSLVWMAKLGLLDWLD